MCLLFVYLNKDPDEKGYKMILASNRDESWLRPTDTAKFRDDNKWFGGIDLEPGREGGTWLGISSTGKVGILLNILAPQKIHAKGRGSLVRDFLTGNTLTEKYQNQIAQSATEYNPFHLLLIDLREDCSLHSVSFCEGTQMLKKPPGVYSGDNSKHIDLPWRKREEGEKIFSGIVKEYGEKDQKDKLVDSIIEMLSSRTQYFPDERLAEQFQDVGRKTVGDLITERSAISVFSPHVKYGTRTNTVILVDKQGTCDYIERTLNLPVDTQSPVWTTEKYQFQLDSN